MKKLRSILVVATLLMVLGFALPVAGASSGEGIKVCSDCPPIDTLNLF